MAPSQLGFYGCGRFSSSARSGLRFRTDEAWCLVEEHVRERRVGLRTPSVDVEGAPQSASASRAEGDVNGLHFLCRKVIGDILPRPGTLSRSGASSTAFSKSPMPCLAMFGLSLDGSLPVGSSVLLPCSQSSSSRYTFLRVHEPNLKLPSHLLRNLGLDGEDALRCRS